MTPTPTPTLTPTPTPTPEPPRTHALSGTFTIRSVQASNRNGIGGLVPADQCFVGPGFEDIATGTAVTIRDGAGVIIGTSQLAGFQLVETYVETMEDITSWDVASDPLRSDFPMVEVTLGYCQFQFQAEVPDADFYTVEVSHRGQVNFSRADLEATLWTMNVSL